MSISDAQYTTHLNDITATVTAKSQEDYLAQYPGSFPAPDPSYAECRATGLANINDMLPEAGRVVHGEIATTNGSGIATVTYAAMTSPVVVATVVQASGTTVYTATVASVSSTSATVRVLASGGLTVLGLAVLGVPAVASGVTVHMMVYDAG